MFSPEESALFPHIFPETLYLIKNEFASKKKQTGAQDDVLEAKPPKTKAAPTQPELKGGNKKKVLILIGDDSLSNPALKELLMKILGAVGLTEEDIALAVLEKTLIPQDYFHASKCHKAVLFGINPSYAGFQSDLYMVSSGNNISAVFSDPLSKVSTDVNVKKKLWQGLKNLFGV
ncbi:hypothetical protein RCC89_10490 [Cytophagaceae bacterium ABcell3]|nr:hypothetical protein RCC89_10490 [Cytophagaceae bacterium ABcell3]